MSESARFISREGDRKRGITLRVPVASPGAGLDWKVTVPGGVVWRVLLATARLAASAAVANRQPSFVITDGNSTLGRFEIAANVVAGGSVGYTFVSGQSGVVAGVSGNFISSGYPLLALETGWTIGTVTTGLDVADQWSGVVLTLEEYHDTATGLSEAAERHEMAEAGLEALLVGPGAQAGAGSALGG